MILFVRATKNLLILIVTLIFLNGCMDETIEGVSSAATVSFKANSVTMPFVALNTCTYTTTPNGTRFNLKIDYQGKEGDPIYQLDHTYKISTSTTVTNGTTIYSPSGFSDTNTSEPAFVFRGKSSNKTTFTINVENFTCWRWGTSSATVDYVFTLTTSSGKTSSISFTLTKPAGAN